MHMPCVVYFTSVLTSRLYNTDRLLLLMNACSPQFVGFRLKRLNCLLNNVIFIEVEMYVCVLCCIFSETILYYMFFGII